MIEEKIEKTVDKKTLFEHIKIWYNKRKQKKENNIYDRIY